MLNVKLNYPLHGSSKYCGQSDRYGRRDGSGVEWWRKQDQRYSGTFVRDAYHGEGCYGWSAGKKRFVFEGQFYSNFKEGYGLVSLPDGSCFEGLFRNNHPFGPGIQTHVNGRQDVGFWSGRRIVRLSRPVDFIIPRLATTPAGKLKLLQFQKLLPFVEEGSSVAASLLEKYDCDPGLAPRLYSNFIHDPRSLFFNRITFDKVFFVKIPDPDLSSDEPSEDNPESDNLEYGDSAAEDGSIEARTIPSHCLCKASEFVMDYSRKELPVCPEKDESSDEMGLLRYYATRGTLDGLLPGLPREEKRDFLSYEAFEDEGEGRASGNSITHLISWNRTELCVDMLKEIFRFRAFEDRLTFKISDLMVGARAKFRKTGARESACIQFLKMCSIGPADTVKEFLCSGEISEALMDARGNNSIMFAAAADQHDIIHLLLNHGVDVNSFNDENLTPLNFCLLRRIALAKCLGNWEAVFLPPEDPLPTVMDERRKTWRVSRSIDSLDRIFGDGTSLRSGELPANAVPIQNCTDQEFLGCFLEEEESSSSRKSTDISLLEDEIGASGITKMTSEYVPPSYKRPEFARSVAPPTDEDRYFFGLSSNKSSIIVTAHNRGNAGYLADEDRTDVTTSSEKLANIDKTIELLLMRGADPNLADAPKPSLHLAVHSGDPNLVRLLLLYGASPDSQTLPQEGLLTSLHIVVLMEPSQDIVDICKLLLNKGASPEEETSPDFNPDGEDYMVDPEHGRTPLQLLCTRRGAQYADPKGFLSQLAILLATVSRRRHFFKGHSYLTLTMMTGNVDLMQSLLRCRATDPNEVLGKELGTAFHVLVSTELQKRTSYEDSIKMCDLLLNSGGDPGIVFSRPPSLRGTAVDYGYREIEREKLRRARRSSVEYGSGAGSAGAKEKDYLEDHLRVVEYLSSKSKPGTTTHLAGKQEKMPAEKAEVSGRRRGPVLGGCERIIGEVKGEQAPKKGKRMMNLVSEADDDGVSQKRENKTDDSNGKGRKVARKKVIDETEIVEIKKHVANAKTKGSRKQRESAEGERMERIVPGRDGGVRKKAEDNPHPPKVNGITSMRRMSTLERLPERFRHSLLHILGFYSEGLDLNDLLLPYAVLRNGDLYYRFKGQKQARTEQYSLI